MLVISYVKESDKHSGHVFHSAGSQTSGFTRQVCSARNGSSNISAISQTVTAAWQNRSVSTWICLSTTRILTRILFFTIICLSVLTGFCYDSVHFTDGQHVGNEVASDRSGSRLRFQPPALSPKYIKKGGELGSERSILGCITIRPGLGGDRIRNWGCPLRATWSSGTQTQWSSCEKYQRNPQ